MPSKSAIGMTKPKIRGQRPDEDTRSRPTAARVRSRPACRSQSNCVAAKISMNAERPNDERPSQLGEHVAVEDRESRVPPDCGAVEVRARSSLEPEAFAQVELCARSASPTLRARCPRLRSSVVDDVGAIDDRERLAHLVIGDQTPMPRSRSWRIIAWMSATAIGSMPVNGSSSKRNAGSVAIARAISTRRRSPPERLSPRASTSLRRPNSSSRPATAGSARRASRRSSPRSAGRCRRRRVCERSSSLARDSRCRCARARTSGAPRVRFRGRSCHSTTLPPSGFTSPTTM